MATTIYQKIASDNTLVLDARQTFQRQINTGSGWTDLRMGMYCALIDTGSGNNTNGANESVGSQNLGANRIIWGLKDDSPTFPTSSGAYFIGMMTSGSTNTSKWNYNYSPYFGIIGSDNSRMYSVGYYNGTLITGSYATFTFNSPDASTVSGTGTYHAAWGMRMVVNNRGASNQSVTVYLRNEGYSTRDYTTDNLRQWLVGAGNYTSIGTVAWNNGSTAYNLPNNLFIYLPFTGIKMRISCLGAWVFSP